MRFLSPLDLKPLPSLSQHPQLELAGSLFTLLDIGELLLLCEFELGPDYER